MKISVRDVNKASENASKVGIKATFTIDILNDNGDVVVSLRECTIRETKRGETYVCPPYRVYQSRGNNRRAYFYYLFPNETDRDMVNSKIIAAVRKEISSGSINKRRESNKKTTVGFEDDGDLF